jgi:hypothetical protein
MSGIALNLRRFAVLNSNQNTARVGAIMRTRGMHYFIHDVHDYIGEKASLVVGPWPSVIGDPSHKFF